MLRLATVPVFLAVAACGGGETSEEALHNAANQSDPAGCVFVDRAA